MPKIDLLGLIFPVKCLGCGKEGSYLCPNCLAKEEFTRFLCPGCQRPAIDGMTHTKCQTRLGLDGQIGLWHYSGVIRRGILALKYKYAGSVARELAERAAENIRKRKLVFPPKSTLVPIPLYWYRENVRGFNQSAEIGRLIATKLGWKFVPDLLIKRSSTTPQAGLARRERLTNVRGAFALNTRYKILNTKSFFILFDDVSTTGATIKEAAKSLKRRGAGQVWGLTLAVTGQSFGKPVGAAV